MVPEPESSLTEAYEKWREWADGKSCCDYALHVDITHWNDSVKQEVQNLSRDKGEPSTLSSLLLLSLGCLGRPSHSIPLTCVTPLV